MKATELRIGNLIQLNKKWFEKNPGLSKTEKIISVDSIGFDYLLPENYKINGYNIGNLEPITLTEEWLLRFGFERNDNYKIKEFVRGDMIIYTYNKVNKEVYYGICVEVKIKYIHQLQNLYFALTGRELKTD